MDTSLAMIQWLARDREDELRREMYFESRNLARLEEQEASVKSRSHIILVRPADLQSIEQDACADSAA
jgi:hypothetical protein